MLVLISPAKTLDFDNPLPSTLPAKKFTQPVFLQNSAQLINELRNLSPENIQTLLSISPTLAVLNWQRFLNWHLPFNAKNARQAVLAFKGDVYIGMQAETFNVSDFTFAQKHLRILSGLYGLLRPLDLIQPYRLEMGTSFANTRGKNLYDFWGNSITDAINELTAESKKAVIINLASNEYFKAIKIKNLKVQVITPVFKDLKNGEYKVISFYAKKARGLMSAYIIKNKITKPQEIKNFTTDGYYFNAELSTISEWVYLRDFIEN